MWTLQEKSDERCRELEINVADLVDRVELCFGCLEQKRGGYWGVRRPTWTSIQRNAMGHPRHATLSKFPPERHALTWTWEHPKSAPHLPVAIPAPQSPSSPRGRPRP